MKLTKKLFYVKKYLDRLKWANNWELDECVGGIFWKV
jgi:hypothetical protein